MLNLNNNLKIHFYIIDIIILLKCENHELFKKI